MSGIHAVFLAANVQPESTSYGITYDYDNLGLM